MSNVQDVNRPSAKQAPVKRLSPSGMPKARTRRLPSGLTRKRGRWRFPHHFSRPRST